MSDNSLPAEDAVGTPREERQEHAGEEETLASSQGRPESPLEAAPLVRDVSEVDPTGRMVDELLDSLRCGYLFGNHDEPLDAAGKRIVRVIQQRLSGAPRASGWQDNGTMKSMIEELIDAYYESPAKWQAVETRAKALIGWPLPPPRGGA